MHPAEHIPLSPGLDTLVWRLACQGAPVGGVVADSRPPTEVPVPLPPGSVMLEWGMSGAAGYLDIASAQLWVQSSVPQRVENGVDRGHWLRLPQATSRSCHEGNTSVA